MNSTWWIIAGLAAALFWAVRRLRAQGRAVRELTEGVRAKRALLRESAPGAVGSDWERLWERTNALLKERESLEQQKSGQLAQLEATLGSVQEAVLVVDSHNYVLLANPALKAIFPKAETILGQRLELGLQSAEFLDYVNAVRAGKTRAQREIEFIDSSRSTWVEVTGTPIPPLSGSKTPCALFVLHDITKQKRLEAVRKDFVANVSHELRTPLSVIKGYVETLVDGGDTVPAHDRDRFLKTIQRHTDRLNSLLEDLLMLSRLESINPGLSREDTDIGQLLGAVLDDYRSRPAAEAHTLVAAIQPGIGPVFLDPLKLTQALENLIDNALKYTPAGSRIELVAKTEGSQLQLGVQDNGPGIPEADLPHIFERFYRVDKGRSRDKGGTGLGLSIVKHIVTLHGGRVWAESSPGRGSAFWLTLPRQRA